MDELIRQLEELGYTVDQSHREQGIVIIKDFQIRAGRDAGNHADVGISGGDFPFSPPAGIHIRPPLPTPAKGDMASPQLKENWRYWSRRLPDWQQERTARHIVSYINKVFLDA